MRLGWGISPVALPATSVHTMMVVALFAKKGGACPLLPAHVSPRAPGSRPILRLGDGASTHAATKHTHARVSHRAERVYLFIAIAALFRGACPVPPTRTILPPAKRESAREHKQWSARWPRG